MRCQSLGSVAPQPLWTEHWMSLDESIVVLLALLPDAPGWVDTAVLVSLWAGVGKAD